MADTEIVKPAKPAPAQVLALSPVDQMAWNEYTCFIMLFPLSTGADNRMIYTKLSVGLSLTLSEIPFIGGYLASVEGSADERLQIKIDEGYGTRLNYRDYTTPESRTQFKSSYDELKRDHFPCSALDPAALMPVQIFVKGPEPAVMATQTNFIDGGLILSVCLHHKASDGMGLASVLKAWAKHTKEADMATGNSLSTATDDLTPRSMDRSSMCNGLIGSQPKDIPEYIVIDVAAAMSSAQAEVAAATTTPVPAASTNPLKSLGPLKLCIVHLPAKGLAHLKSAASPPIASDGWISTNDAICALLWRHITRVRTDLMCTLKPDSPLPPQTPLNFAVAVEARRRMIPALPSEYLGNAAFQCTVTSDLDTVASPSTPLSRLARLIREAVTGFDSAKIQEVIGLVDSVARASDVLPKVLEDPMRGLIVTSWVDMGLYDIEWGASLGRTESVRVPGVTLEEGIPFCGIFPRRPDDGLEVLICLEEAAIPALRKDEEFAAFAEWRAL